MGGTSFTFAKEGNELDKIGYPGGVAVIPAKATAKSTSSDGNDYTFGFKLTVTGTNLTKTDITWKLYSSDTPLSQLSLNDCYLITEPDTAQNKTYYYYSTENEVDGVNHGKEKSCTTSISGLSSLSTQIGTGTIAKSSDGENPGQATGAESIEAQSIVVSGGSTKDKYYYLVLEYPNTGEQDEDKNKTINASLTVDGDVSMAPSKAAD